MTERHSADTALSGGTSTPGPCAKLLRMLWDGSFFSSRLLSKGSF